MKINQFFLLLDFLRKQLDVLQISEFDGIECDSDEEIQEIDSDSEYYSDDETTRNIIDYDLDKMFEIVKLRDFHKWSISSINHRYRKISNGDTGRKQISR